MLERHDSKSWYYIPVPKEKNEYAKDFLEGTENMRGYKEVGK